MNRCRCYKPGASIPCSFRAHKSFRPLCFALKPEHPWTKQHDPWLYFDAALEPCLGQPLGIRVCMPGGTATIVRSIPRANRPVRPAAAVRVQTNYIVRLPRAGKDNAASLIGDEAFTLKPPPPFRPIPVPLPPSANGQIRAPQIHLLVPSLVSDNAPPLFPQHPFTIPPAFIAPLPFVMALDPWGMPFDPASGRPITMLAPWPIPVTYGSA
ncbi:hypothetical protein B0H13DRAFT_2025637 [Mycena leptocephala]|nr:hypothetical protein B0H13DRAFT_2025637 [Mycena leptocephala]